LSKGKWLIILLTLIVLTNIFAPQIAKKLGGNPVILSNLLVIVIGIIVVIMIFRIFLSE